MSSSPSSLDNQPQKKSRRIAKACFRCHERKVKCSGGQPCVRCFKENRECIYNRESKPRKPRRKKNEMPSGEKTDRRSSVKARLGHDKNGVADHSKSATTAPRRASKLGENNDTILKTLLAETHPADPMNFSQPSFTLFSPRGIRWIISSLKLDQKEYTLKVVCELKTAVHGFQRHLIEGLKIWIEPVSSITPFPPKDFCLSISARYFTYATPYSNILSQETVDNYFDRYFNPSKIRAPLGYSEMLIMNLLLVHGITYKLEEGDADELGCIFSKEHLRDIKRKHWKNAIYLYQRIAITGDGLTGVQALLLLVQYCQMSMPANSVYVIISTMVRLAQELGLHRREAYYGLPDEHIRKRILLWWGCYHFDKMHCLVSGKPPVINDQDISVIYPSSFIKLAIYLGGKNLSPKEILETSYLLIKNASNSALLEEITKIDLNNTPPEELDRAIYSVSTSLPFNISSLVSFYMTDLSTIGAKFYRMLISPGQISCIHGFSNFDKKIGMLNNELVAWKERVPKAIRPGFKIDLAKLGFDDHHDSSYLCVLNLHFNYYAMSMIINRMGSIPSLYGGKFAEHSTSQDHISDSARFSIDSATKLLELSKTVDKSKTHFWNICLPHVLSAIVTLFCYCVKDPSMESLGRYILLLADSVRSFFKARIEFSELAPHSKKWKLLHRVFSLIVYLLVDFYKNDMGDQMISNDKDINIYIETIRLSIEGLEDESVLSENRYTDKKSELKSNLMNGFYTLNLASKVLPPKFSQEFTDQSSSSDHDNSSSKFENISIDTPVNESALQLQLLKNFDFAPALSEFNDGLATNNTNNNGAIPDMLPHNNILHGDYSTDTNDLNQNFLLGNLEYQDNGYLYQSVFNLPNMFLGDLGDTTNFESQAPDLMFDPTLNQ